MSPTWLIYKSTCCNRVTKFTEPLCIHYDSIFEVIIALRTLRLKQSSTTGIYRVKLIDRTQIRLHLIEISSFTSKRDRLIVPISSPFAPEFPFRHGRRAYAPKPTKVYTGIRTSPIEKHKIFTLAPSLFHHFRPHNFSSFDNFIVSRRKIVTQSRYLTLPLTDYHHVFLSLFRRSGR